VNKLVVIVLAGCGVSNSLDGVDPPDRAESTSSSSNGGHAPCDRYHIQEIPTSVPSGATSAARAICNGGGAVGTAAITSDAFHAVVYDDGQVTDLGTLGAGNSVAQDGNAHGTIVGGSNTGSSFAAFVYRDGAMTELVGLGGDSAEAWAINDREEIAGVSSIPPGGDTDNHTLLWEPGESQPIDLTVLNGGHYSYPRDINEQGEIVGTDLTLDHHSRAVVWRDRVLVELDSGGAPDASATAINDAGTIVGTVLPTPPSQHAVIWQGDVLIDLGGLLGSPSGASGIDNAGDVVGSARFAGNDRNTAFLYSKGAVVNLDDSIDQTGWLLTEATDICDDGTIVGNGEHDGIGRGFVLTPAH
jgi:probable HAF family extracellular repeat protein